MMAQTLDPPFPVCVTEDTLFKAFEPYCLHLWTEAKSSPRAAELIKVMDSVILLRGGLTRNMCFNY